MTKNFYLYGYLPASTKEQDTVRAKDVLIDFAANSNLSVASFCIENESGAKLDRPELFRLLAIVQQMILFWLHRYRSYIKIK